MKKRTALTFLELVFALAILFIGATAVTSLLVAGAGWPKRTQQSNYRDRLAHQELKRIFDSGLLPSAAPYSPVPGEPRYEFQVVTRPAPFASNATVVEVGVRGPLPDPQPLETSLRGLYTRPDPVQLFNQYQCYTCHAFTVSPAGVLPRPPLLTPPLTGPDFNATNLTAGMDQANLERSAAGRPALASKDAYLEEAIRFPNASVVATFGTPAASGLQSSMNTFPDVTAMPQADLEALKSFIRSNSSW